MADTTSSYPMISEKNWWTIRDKFKASLPSAATANYIKTLLTLSSENSANNNVILPMKRLGLLDEDNKPTSLANDWRLDTKYKSACDTMIKNVYPTELLDLFPGADVDRATAKNWFMGKGVGEATADKMVALFTLLKSGEIRDKKAPSSKKLSIFSKPSERKDKLTQSNEIERPTANDKPEECAKNINRPNLHIDLQIHISPDSTPEQIEAIFASMAKHLYGANIE